MIQIGEYLEEKLKDELNYEHKPVSHQRKLFDKLKTLCMKHRIQMKLDGHFVKEVRIFLHQGDEQLGYYWAKPVVRHGRLYLSFKQPIKRLIDASHVDVFGEAVQHPE